MHLIERAMESHRASGCRGYVLDGFPLTLEQAEVVSMKSYILIG